MEVFEQLITSIDEKKLSIFTGAAISYSSPSSVPSWFGFRDDIIKAISSSLLDGGDSSLEQSVRLLLESDLRPEIILEGIDRFGGMTNTLNFLKSFESGKPNNYHFAIAELFKKNLVQHIITTNWDSYIEKAIGDNYKYKLVYSENDITSTNISQKDQIVLHLHGKIDGFKFVQAGLFRIGFFLFPPVEELLHNILKNDCLFIGFSGDDWDIFSALVTILEKHDTRFYWLYLKKYGLSKNIAKLSERYPQKVFPIEGDFDSLFKSIFAKLAISPITVPVTNFNINYFSTYKNATKELGKIASCLTMSFAYSSRGMWTRAMDWCEYAEDLAFSTEEYKYHRAEIFRLESTIAACSGNYERSDFLLRSAILEYQKTTKSMVASLKISALLEYQKGLNNLCCGKIELAEEFLAKSLRILQYENRAVEMGILKKSEFLILNISIANLYAITQAINSKNTNEAIIIHQEIYEKQTYVRNIWGRCTTLLSLSLCYYRQNRINEADMALEDCIFQSERAGIIPCNVAAKKNLSIIMKKKPKFENFKNSITDKNTKWNLELDPFSVMLYLNSKN